MIILMNGSPSSIVQSAIEKQLSEQTIEEREILDFNPIALYFGEDYELRFRERKQKKN